MTTNYPLLNNKFFKVLPTWWLVHADNLSWFPLCRHRGFIFKTAWSGQGSTLRPLHSGGGGENATSVCVYGVQGTGFFFQSTRPFDSSGVSLRQTTVLTSYNFGSFNISWQRHPRSTDSYNIDDGCSIDS